MVGRDLGALFPKLDAEVGAPVLTSHRLTREGVFTDVSFEVRGGEIVALAGLVGAGRSEVARAIFGIDQPDGGDVEVDGRRLPPGARSPRCAPAWGSSPRTAASRASSWTSRSAATRRSRACAS